MDQIGLFASIGSDGQRPAPIRRVDFRRNSFQPITRTSRNHDIGAVFGISLCYMFTDARSTAGQSGSAPLKAKPAGKPHATGSLLSGKTAERHCGEGFASKCTSRESPEPSQKKKQ